MKLKEIYVVLCGGISDIGKGWLTSAIGALDPINTLPIKIDPLLNRYFPHHLGVEISQICAESDIQDFVVNYVKNKNFRVSEDMLTYHEVGMPVYPECNIVAGDLIYRYLDQVKDSPKYIRDQEYKKLTFNDLSFFLAEQIMTIVKRRNPRRILIEIGGTVEDREMIYIPAAMRYLSMESFLGVLPEVIFLSYLDYAETEGGIYNVKTQHARRGIIEACRAYYGLPIRACFVRRRSVPERITDEVLTADLKNIAYETQIDLKTIHLLPNILRDDLQELTTLIKNAKIFSENNEEPAIGMTKNSATDKNFLISACLLNVPCQYDGQIARHRLDIQFIHQSGLNFIPICPEQLGGLPTPRDPSEIKGGDGNDVLEGKAQVLTKKGEDKTAYFIRGAKATFEIAKACGADKMITQRRSPSCSCRQIYDGTFSHTKRDGMGVTAAYLKAKGIELIGIDEFNSFE